MRIISGKHKGYRFYPPRNLPVRPTTDYAKSGLFNILNNEFDFATVSLLDLFCGTGSISFEFSSRGCTQITAIDKSFHCVKYVREMTKTLDMEGIEVYKSDVFKFLHLCIDKFDIIFTGPPYAVRNIPALPGKIFELGLLNKEGWLIVEHSKQLSLAEVEHYKLSRSYGSTIFSIFTH